MALGLIIARRAIFSESQVARDRIEILDFFKKRRIDVVALAENETQCGALSNHNEARKCAELFRRNRDRIEGVIVALPNFGDERSVADALKMAALDVPVLVQAYPDELDKMDEKNRRDSFCGKISVCNNLRQYGIKYSLGRRHTVSPHSAEFDDDVKWFAGVCRVVNGLRKARIGVVGTRPGDFKTVRSSETLLEKSGVSVETIGLLGLVKQIEKLADSDPDVIRQFQAMQNYCAMPGIPESTVIKMAKLNLALTRWIGENDLDAFALQCWPDIQEALQIFPCAAMSMLNDRLVPSGCEADIAGTVAMLALQLASGTASALMDWNNNYGDDPDKAVLFHCSNAPRRMFKPGLTMRYNVGATSQNDVSNCYGSCWGKLREGAFTYCGIKADGSDAVISAYAGSGLFTADALETYGGTAVAEIKGLQKLVRYICENGFDHHVAINHSAVADILAESFKKYMGWNVYGHTDGMV